MFSTKEGRVESIETVPDTENDPIKQPYYITNSHTAMNENKVQELQDVVIRFSGDSGDGMQLTGTLFSDTSALLGNGISTFPDYPAEIRAPQGTVAGVSGFQVHFGAKRQLNPGDFCDVLIAMNPAALKANRKWLKPGATVILDEDSITEEHLRKAGFATLDPIRELNLEDFNVVVPNITEMTKAALADSGLDNKAMVKCKNMFATGYLLLPLQPSRGSCETLPRFKICEEKSGYSRSQQTRYRRRLQLCRQHASVRQYIYRRIGPDGERHLPVDQR